MEGNLLLSQNLNPIQIFQGTLRCTSMESRPLYCENSILLWLSINNDHELPTQPSAQWLILANEWYKFTGYGDFESCLMRRHLCNCDGVCKNRYHAGKGISSSNTDFCLS